MDHASFGRAKNTYIVSDIHLTTAAPVHPKDPLWRRFKQKKFFIDSQFKDFLKNIQKDNPDDSSIELILAGDIFDFDGVTESPETHRFKVTLLERRRGLNAEERKSRFKIRLVLSQHPVFFQALKEFIEKGHRVVFVIGNHDLELHWKSVQKEILDFMELTDEERTLVRFNRWFYISNKDTLIEHGNQYDSHSNCQDPIHPFIRGFRRPRVRLPFGCLAHRYMLNGMGYFNPHSERTYIMGFVEYMTFFFKHLIRREPLIMWTWLQGAMVTLVMTLREGMLPTVNDPFGIDDIVDEIAKDANSTPKVVRSLREIHAPPTFTDPVGIARELWLDRAAFFFGGFLLLYILLGSINFVWQVSFFWIFPLFILMLPFFVFYFRSIKSKIPVNVGFYRRAVLLGAKIAGVSRVIYGHTHKFAHANFNGVEHLNSGTWAPAFDDIECTKPTVPKTFVWIKPDPEESSRRIANVYAWEKGEAKLLC